MVISTAYLDEAERCDRLALLHQGRMMYCDTPAGLRARMPGALIEISSTAPREVREAVASQAGVHGTLMVGDGVHVHVDALSRLPELEAALSTSNVVYSAARPVTPSMEDLFVALLGQEAGVQ